MGTPSRRWNELLRRAFFVLREDGIHAFVTKSVVNLRDLMRPPTYDLWISRYDTLTKRSRRNIHSEITRWPIRPLISLIMPVYNTDPRWLNIAIQSVQSQLYPNWELCISDDASTLDRVRDVLRGFGRQDPRIRISLRESNGNMSANSNSALALASGQFIALMDADDALPEHALYWVAKEIIAHPDADLLYSDEDKIDEQGKRFDPNFKTEWNPALMLSQNAFSHLGVFRKSLVERLGAFRLGLEGSQDHDLVLRCALQTSAKRIRHIPRILYHWR